MLIVATIETHPIEIKKVELSKKNIVLSGVEKLANNFFKNGKRIVG